MKTKRLAISKIERIALIGCGGTGAFLAEHLCRMITGFRLDCTLVLADGDNVERANIWRQNFCPHEIGQNKAEALAFRLTGQFGIVIEAIRGFVNSKTLAKWAIPNSLIITATDTLASRRIVAEGSYSPFAPFLWLDVGNEKTFGQAIIGTTHESLSLRKVWYKWSKEKGYVTSLPDIAAINPSILRARKPRKRAGCGQMPFAEQGFGINAMAAQAASLLAKQAVVDGVVSTAAIYFDANSGRMAPRLIDKDLFRPWMRKEK